MVNLLPFLAFGGYVYLSISSKEDRFMNNQTYIEERLPVSEDNIACSHLPELFSLFNSSKMLPQCSDDIFRHYYNTKHKVPEKGHWVGGAYDYTEVWSGELHTVSLSSLLITNKLQHWRPHIRRTCSTEYLLLQ